MADKEVQSNLTPEQLISEELKVRLANLVEERDTAWEELRKNQEICTQLILEVNRVFYSSQIVLIAKRLID
jgi:hypothetical protein